MAIAKCPECGTNLNDDCTVIWKCRECGKAFKASLPKLYKIQKHKQKIIGKNVLKCSKCGHALVDGNEDIICKCSTCGNVIAGNLEYFADGNFKQAEKKDIKNKSRIDGLRSMRIKVIILAVICIIVSGVFFSKGNNVKNEYYNSEYSTLNKNAYVNGDAYNYIINGTYFTGYSVIASAMLICGMILISNSIVITIKIKEYEWQEMEKKKLLVQDGLPPKV